MKNYTRSIEALIFISLFTFSASCKGQVKTGSPTDDVREQSTITGEQPKMVKKQGTYSYMTYTGPRTDTSVCINAVIEDRHGNIWVATMGEGVYCYNGKSFSNYTVKDGLLTNIVYSIIEDTDGNIWLGMVGGVSCYNGKSFINFPFGVIQDNYTPSLETNRIIIKKADGATPEVWSMCQDKTGNIWLGTTEGVYRYDGTTFKDILELGTSNTKDLNIHLVSSIIEDKKGNIWFTSWAGGLCRFDGASITSFKNEVSADFGLLEDKNGNIWITRRGDGGVYCYNRKEFKILFPGINISAMKEDKSGNIWFCTFPKNKTSGGVIYYNPSTSETISHFTTKEGISSNKVSSITIDKSGKVWFGTHEMTLDQYDGKNFTHFSSE